MIKKTWTKRKPQLLRKGGDTQFRPDGKKWAVRVLYERRTQIYNRINIRKYRRRGRTPTDSNLSKRSSDGWSTKSEAEHPIPSARKPTQFSGRESETDASKGSGSGNSTHIFIELTDLYFSIVALAGPRERRDGNYSTPKMSLTLPHPPKGCDSHWTPVRF